MHVQKLAKVLGWIFILLGVLGFVPGVTNADDMLLGIFQVGPLHNVIYLISGVLALWLGRSVAGAKSYCKIFGIVYALMTVLGFLSGEVLGLISVNLADNILHLVIAVVALWAGFSRSAPKMTNLQQGQQM